MSSEESSKLPISKAFWSLMVFSLVSLLIGVSPDSTDKYKNGLQELKELQKLFKNINTTYNYVAPKVEIKLGISPIKSISTVIDSAGKATISDNVLPNIDYFWVDQGPLSLPDKVSDLYEIFQQDVNYSVRVPVVSQLTASLGEVLKSSPEHFKYVSDINISCNYANLRCNVSVTLNNDRNESQRHYEEFKIDALFLNLEKVTFWGKVYDENSYFNPKTIHLEKIEKILYEVYDLTIDQAIKSLNVKLYSTQGDVSALGISIKGDSVILAVPLLVLSAMLMVLVCLRELGEDSDESRYLDTPLFYKTKAGRIGKQLTYVYFPTISVVVMVTRFFEFSSIVAWFGGVFMIGVIVCSYSISKQLKAINMNPPNKSVHPTAKSAAAD